MRDNGLSNTDFNKSLFALIFAGMGIGQASLAMGDSEQAAKASIRIYGFFDRKEKVKSPAYPTNIEKFNGRIEFVNASFRYPSRRSMLFRNMNLVVEPGNNVAFVGPSGSGKSTIIQLLLRYYDLEKGEIFLNGSATEKDKRIGIKQISLKNLRQIFGLVGQEPFLFNASIHENVKYNMAANDQEIEEACKTANAMDFITGDKEKLYDAKNTEEKTGLYRYVGVKGSKLSGGQKQRLAIARVIVRNPQAYLFDEATSALDSKSEDVVAHALEQICRGKTTINIAHRLSSIAHCEPIYVISEKKIKEQGTFEELMHMKGVFWKLSNDT